MADLYVGRFCLFRLSDFGWLRLISLVVGWLNLPNQSPKKNLTDSSTPSSPSEQRSTKSSQVLNQRRTMCSKMLLIRFHSWWPINGTGELSLCPLLLSRRRRTRGQIWASFTLIWYSLLFYRPYSRQKAVYPVPGLKRSKFWPSVSRVDDGKFSVSAFRIEPCLVAIRELIPCQYFFIIL